MYIGPKRPESNTGWVKVQTAKHVEDTYMI